MSLPTLCCLLVQVTVLLNMAAALLALEEYGEAAQRCGQVLELQADNTSALIRRAKAKAARRDYEVSGKRWLCRQVGLGLSGPLTSSLTTHPTGCRG